MMERATLTVSEFCLNTHALQETLDAYLRFGVFVVTKPRSVAVSPEQNDSNIRTTVL